MVSKKIRNSLLVGGVAVIGIVGIAGTLQRVFAAAGGNAGNGNGVTGGGCGSPSKTSWFDTCYGATWKYYSTSSNEVSISGSSSGSVQGGTIKDCAYQDVPNADGTFSRVNIGGYYRLGLEKYNPSVWNRDRNNPAAASLGEQVGIIRNGDLRLLGGNINFVVVGGSITLDDASAKFQTAVSKGVVPDGVSWDGGLGWFCYNEEWGTPNDTPPVNPPDPPGPSGGSGGGYYYATSTVDIPSQSHDVSHHNQTSEGEDGEVIVKLSTDRDSFTGNFQHALYYKHTAGSGNFDDAITNYTVKETINGVITRTDIEVDDFRTNGGSNASKTGIAQSSATVSLAEGEKKTVCHIIEYNPKTISFTSDYGGWRTMSGSGSGSSKACYEVTRPENPRGKTWSTSTMPRTSGSTDGTIMYTGEDASIGWDVWAKSVPTRRYAAYREVVYTTKATQNYYNGITSGNLTTVPRNPRDPCTYYNGKADNTGCTNVWDRNEIAYNNGPVTTETSAPSRQANIVVPDYVGYKYCNSAGWKFEYWVSYTQNGQDNWFKENKDYWTTYDATCRAIAKKPSLGIWNGSILSNGGVRTALGSRYDDTRLGRYINGRADTLYGSWSEYLSVVNKTVNGLGSGASLALGSRTSLDLFMNSPLTIANNTSNLGNSGVSANTTLRTRLDTFLKNRAIESGEVYEGNRTSFPVNNQDTNSLNLGDNITASRIVYVKGDLEINHNIKLNVGNYNNIYQVPQVVIFVDGNVRVASDVTQIDAWLIINGNLDTCSGFVAGSYNNDGSVASAGSEADAVNRISGVCSKQLAFNGPVMASSLTLHRSYGSDPKIRRNDAYRGSNALQNLNECTDDNSSECSKRYSVGEIFNFRADSYLWAYAQAGRYDSSYTESYSRELAPRY